MTHPTNTKKRKPKEVEYSIANKPKDNGFAIILFSALVGIALITAASKLVLYEPTKHVVVEQVKPVVAETVKPLLTEKLTDVGVFNELKVWQVVYRLNWDYPKTVARLAAAEIGVKYNTKFSDLSDEQKAKLFPLIIEKGKLLKR